MNCGQLPFMSWVHSCSTWIKQLHFAKHYSSDMAKTAVSHLHCDRKVTFGEDRKSDTLKYN